MTPAIAHTLMAHLVQPPFASRISAGAFLRGLATYALAAVRLKLICAAERRRMRRVRRDPGTLVARLARARTVLIVCHGNIIRSPFTAALLARTLGAPGPVSISSAGLAAVDGKRAHPRAVLAATGHGVNLADHLAARVTREAVVTADVIFAMDVVQLAELRCRHAMTAAKTFLLTSLASEAPFEIVDPVQGDDAEFQACFTHISRAVRPIAGILSAVAPCR